MAVDNEPYHEAPVFTQSQNTFYPLAIPVSHWQLRHYISHPEPNVLYYASGRDVFYLNTQTKKHKHIATIPFEARCTASGHGYVCVGGEDEGHFAIIKLGSAGAGGNVDDPLPLDYSALSRSAERNTAPRALSVQVTRVGDDIVNSISIHRIHDQDAHLYDLVAILTNNDRTVRTYSLQAGRETNRLNMPFAMNHASLSPDGKCLVAVGDKNCVFMFDRAVLDDPPQIPKPHNRLDMTSATWLPLTELDLFVPSSDDPVHRGYFTTAWSPSGHLLAIGSEAGYITVIDMALLRRVPAEDIAECAVVGVVHSSRPNITTHMCPGAVRCMAFSPDPWDLLVWAEDRGRICIADLRTGLESRQTIELDTKSEGLSKVELEYVSIDSDGHVPSVRVTGINTSDDMRADIESAESYHGPARPRVETTLFHDDPRGLTAHEQQVLDSLRIVRQRQEALAAIGTGSIPTINYTTPAAVASRSARDRTAEVEDDSFPALSRVYATTPGTAMGSGTVDDSVDPDGRTHARPPSILERSRRRYRRVLLAGESTSDTAEPATGFVSDTSDGAQADEMAWQTISNAMSTARDGTTSATPEGYEALQNSYITRYAQLTEQRERLRMLQASLERSSGAAAGATTAASGSASAVTADPWSDDPTMARMTSANNAMIGSHDMLRDATSAAMLLNRRIERSANSVAAFGARSLPRREYGVRTAGLAISDDGSTVWAATEEGIFEIKIALKQRLVWSSIDYE